MQLFRSVNSKERIHQFSVKEWWKFRLAEEEQKERQVILNCSILQAPAQTSSL
jgi:hypothetical protein